MKNPKNLKPFKNTFGFFQFLKYIDLFHISLEMQVILLMSSVYFWGSVDVYSVCSFSLDTNSKGTN